ncbi:hypothetical protein BJ508DRAFT_43569 [Ascobolus immersus RN42]|uniref:Uncharacterized protein n=1 Tax=Ascobolus immersus RN42 TaxID=1160509 RepID=A0A3N4IHV1_ASCIM|nr:hypothetical protein BJ508DRAFT_43569 [Ascobolus immersus RN42]
MTVNPITSPQCLPAFESRSSSVSTILTEMHARRRFADQGTGIHKQERFHLTFGASFGLQAPRSHLSRFETPMCGDSLLYLLSVSLVLLLTFERSCFLAQPSQKSGHGNKGADFCSFRKGTDCLSMLATLSPTCST